MSGKRPRIALWFRYGPAEHAELFHAMPEIVSELAKHAEVHYFGMKSTKPIPAAIADHAIIHHLPFHCNRTDGRDKVIKTILWVLAIPWIGLYCRCTGIRWVYIDETVPLTAPLARLFFGPQIAFTIADMFVDIYRERNAWVRFFGDAIKRWDTRTWRRLPLIFTRAYATRAYLEKQGFDPARIHPVYDPCDFSIYHPLPEDERREARQQFGLRDDQVVLVHHGILHPNKGNDRILRTMADMIPEHPNVHYLLVGDGPEMSRLAQMVEELGLQQYVTLTGWLPRLEDVNRALNAGDIGLVMRIGQESDDFHMTGALVHAMACGLPILAARLGGVAEVVIPERNGLLFDPSDLSSLKEQWIQLMNSPERRTEYGEQAARDARAHFDVATVVRKTTEPLLHSCSLNSTSCPDR